MTYKEMAAEWVDSQMMRFIKEQIPPGDFAMEAYLVGLEAGKDMNVSTKWHDLRKNPNDLPPLEKGAVVYATIDVLIDRGEIAYYYYDGDESCWCDINANEIDPPKAWCYIPKFEEEIR